jgi:hypothetical protein
MCSSLLVRKSTHRTLATPTIPLSLHQSLPTSSLSNHLASYTSTDQQQSFNRTTVFQLPIQTSSPPWVSSPTKIKPPPPPPHRKLKPHHKPISNNPTSHKLQLLRRMTRRRRRASPSGRLLSLVREPRAYGLLVGSERLNSRGATLRFGRWDGKVRLMMMVFGGNEIEAGNTGSWERGYP